MYSSVCQGLQSCLEPTLVESRFLRLKLAPPKPSFSGFVAPSPSFPTPAPPDPKRTPYAEENNTNTPIASNKNNANDCKLVANQNIDMGGWSFLQSLANAKESTENEKVYVHPLVKRSASTLTEKSLEMCTESLGSETGSEVSEGHDDISLETLVCSNPSKPRESLVTRKMTRSSSFPPPLTSISGSSGVQVRSHREGGRLLLQAVNIPTQSYFHAERSEGRLRLSLLKDTTSIFNIEDSEDEEEEAVVVEEEDDDVAYYEENGVEEEEEEEDEERCWGEDMEGNSGNVGGEIGTGKLAMPSCCKESGRGQHKDLLNWETFCLAT